MTTDKSVADSLAISNATQSVAIPRGVDLPPKGEGDHWALWLSRLQYLTELTPERRHRGHWVPIHWEINRSILGEKHRQRINDMRDAEIIEVNERYSTGREGTAAFCKSYRLTRDHRDGQSRIHTVQTRPAQRKAAKLWEPNHTNLGESGIHYHGHSADFWMLDMAADDAQLSDHWSQANIARWQSRHAFATRCDHRRYHALITQTPRAARKYLATQSVEPLSIVDISACQPLIIGYLAATGITTTEGLRRALLPYGAGFSIDSAPEDVRRWIELCQQRLIYRHVWEAIREQPEPVWVNVTTNHGRRVEIDLRDQSEKAFKRGSLVPLFDRVEAAKRSPVFQLIERDFPSIANWTLQTKCHGHQTTAHLCQRLESHLMIDGCGDILRRKYRHEPVQPIHDALLVESRFAPTAHGIIADQFARIGVKPQTKTEPC